MNKQLCLFLLLMTAACRLLADVNILIIGSDTPGDQQYASRLSGSPGPTPAFQYEEMADELRQILTGAGVGAVNVTTRERYAGSSGNYCTNLATWFYWPYGEWEGNHPDSGEWYANVTGTETERWAELRGEDGTAWDYVVLIGDPYTIEATPGFYTLGVAKIAEEVAEGTGEAVLLMPWPAAGSSSSLDHYKEVVYRTGRTAGIPVAPAGLAWQDAGSPADATHPSADGAYIAAATLYSRLFGESASATSYSYDDGDADTADATVTANQGAPQYSGTFEFNNPFAILGDKRRHIRSSNKGSSTENRIRRHLNGGTLPDLNVTQNFTRESYNSNTPADDGLGWPYSGDQLPIAFNWGRQSGSKSYETNRTYWQLGFGFIYQYGNDNAEYISEAADAELERAYLMKEGTNSSFSYNLSAYDQQEEIASARLIPLRTLWAIIDREYPEEFFMADQSHVNRALGKSGATFLYTTYSGRTPVQDEAQSSVYVQNPALNHFAQRVGYETAWILGRVQARAPGFKVTPATTNRSASSEIMSIRFLFPPQEDVTVNVSVSDPSLAELSRQTILFTPDNYADPVEISVRALQSEDGSNQSYDVQFATSSNDEVFDNLSDSWAFEMPNNVAPGLTITAPSAGAPLPNGDLTVTANASDPDGTVTGVTLRINGALVRQDTTAPYQWSAGDGDSLLAGLADDLYELEFVAVDNQGATYTVSRTVTVGSPSTIPPAAPEGFSASVDAGTVTSSVQLEWDDNSEGDFASYSVYRTTVEGNYGSPLASELDLSTYTDTEVENDTTYYYVVTAVDVFGNESALSAEIAATPQLGPGLTVFGSDNNGFGGFTTSAETNGQVWTETTDSVHYAFDSVSTNIASLLKSYTLDRSSGSTYTIEGVVDLTDGYGDDNNRMGILLFNNNATQTSNGGGGLYLRLNADGAGLGIYTGVSGSALASTNATGSFSGDSWIGTTITFKADIEFSGANINVDFTFMDQSGHQDTMSATVSAANYTGTYFGFASKWRNRGVSSSNKDVPPDFDYRSFLVMDTRPPSAPTGLNAVADDGFVSLDWDDNGESDLSGYALWRGTAAGDYGATPFVEGLTVSEYSDTSLVSGTTYYYAVTARDLSSNESGFSDEASVTYVEEDPETDSDGNGIADAWELEHFDAIGLIDGSGDADGDGLADFFEYQFDGDPNDPADRGTPLEAVRSQETGGMVFHWSEAPGMTAGVDYHVRISTDLSGWDPLPEGATLEAIPGDAGRIELTLPTSLGDQVFVRLVKGAL